MVSLNHSQIFCRRGHLIIRGNFGNRLQVWSIPELCGGHTTLVFILGHLEVVDIKLVFTHGCSLKSRGGTLTFLMPQSRDSKVIGLPNSSVIGILNIISQILICNQGRETK